MTINVIFAQKFLELYKYIIVSYWLQDALAPKLCQFWIMLNQDVGPPIFPLTLIGNIFNTQTHTHSVRYSSHID